MNLFITNCIERLTIKRNTRIKSFIYYLERIFSPTLLISGCIKDKSTNKSEKTKILKNLNTIYIAISISSLFISLIVYKLFNYSIPLHTTGVFFLIWCYYLLSRNNEIFLAFLHDAFDKLNQKDSNSNLTVKNRITLSFKSYLELIINFAIVYALLPLSYWKCMSSNILDSLYFSGVTITTLGYGDISPIHWFPKLLSIYEVFCGFILLIVCFTIYTNLKTTQKTRMSIRDKKFNVKKRKDKGASYKKQKTSSASTSKKTNIHS